MRASVLLLLAVLLTIADAWAAPGATDVVGLGLPGLAEAAPGVVPWFVLWHLVSRLLDRPGPLFVIELRQPPSSPPASGAAG